MVRAPSLFVLCLLLAGCAPEPVAPVIQVGGLPPEPEPPPGPLRAAVPVAKPPEPVEPAEPPPPPPVAPVPTRAPPPVPAGPALDVARDLRPNAHSLRSIPLLITELQGLETLLTTIAKSNSDRPKLLRRIGHTYSELATSAQQAGRANVVTSARRQAIVHYETFATQYPQPCPAGAPAYTPCGDEALYYLALEQERDGDLNRARKSHLNLIQGHPGSSFIPGAYLAFGEMFLAESVQDPFKLPLAEQSYQQVLRYPPPGNALFGYAHHQLGRTHAQRGQRARAAAAFKAAIAWAGKFPQAPAAADIAASARQELGALGVP